MFCDTEHVIRWMNRAAIAHYTGGASLLGSSVLACHSERSCEQIHEVFARMQQGLDEELISDNERRRIYMRAVRDDEGRLIGYYERYEVPRGQ